MGERAEVERRGAVDRYLQGESVSTICASLRRSRTWFHRWLNRYESGDPGWFRERSRRPKSSPSQTPRGIEERVKQVRGHLEKQGEFCGAQSIRWELEEQGVEPLPSIRTIGRILVRENLTRRRHGAYESKRKKYPKLVGITPGEVHQTDFVGPCYLRRGPRFYSMNSVDLATGRCATEPTPSQDAQATLNAFWSSWKRLGMPRHQQVDNAMVFYGSPRYPRAMGPLLRMCLLNEIEVWFIPVGEPWRNGVVEKFNDIWQQKFLGRIELESEVDLRPHSRRFEERHNRRYRYGKLGGRTPLDARRTSGVALRFPSQGTPPRHPLPRPEGGRYHLVRFVRSDAALDVFGEKFAAPPECVHEYVRLTIDVARGRLQVFLDDQLVEEHDYLRTPR